MNCQICHVELLDKERVIFSHRKTFTFKPADVPDVRMTRTTPDGKEIQVSAAAVLSPAELAESRKDHQRTAVVNTFGEWGKMLVPQDAFYFRHQWCEPQRTGAGGGAHPVNKHAIRFNRNLHKRSSR